MTITELITALEAKRAEMGDVPVYLTAEAGQVWVEVDEVWASESWHMHNPDSDWWKTHPQRPEPVVGIGAKGV